MYYLSQPLLGPASLWEPVEETHRIKWRILWLMCLPGVETIGLHRQYFKLTFDGWGKVARRVVLTLKEVKLIFIWTEVARKTITLLGIMYLLGFSN